MDEKKPPFTIIRGAGAPGKQPDRTLSLGLKTKGLLRRDLYSISQRVYSDAEIDQINLALFHPDRTTREKMLSAARTLFPELIEFFEKHKIK